MRAYLLGVLWCGSSPFDEYSREDSSTYANSFAVLCQNLPQNLYLHVSFTWRTGESTRFDPRSWRLSLVLVLASVVYRQFLGFTVPHLYQSFKFQFHFVKFKKIEKKMFFVHFISTRMKHPWSSTPRHFSKLFSLDDNASLISVFFLFKQMLNLPLSNTRETRKRETDSRRRTNVCCPWKTSTRRLWSESSLKNPNLKKNGKSFKKWNSSTKKLLKASKTK